MSAPARLTSAEVLALAAAAGRPIAAATWRAYVHRGQAPAPVAHVGRTPLWRRADVEAWLAGAGRGR